MSLAALAFIVCLAQEPTVDDLIRQLESESLSERDEAQRRLKTRAREAKALLEKAAQRTDPELASRAKKLLEFIAILDREQITPELQAELPTLAEKLVTTGNDAWHSVFLEQTAAGAKPLKPATLAFLAPRAARAAKSVEDRTKICEALIRVS